MFARKNAFSQTNTPPKPQRLKLTPREKSADINPLWSRLSTPSHGSESSPVVMREPASSTDPVATNYAETPARAGGGQMNENPYFSEMCRNVKTSPDSYSFFKVSNEVTLKESYCLLNMGKKNTIQIRGNWYWYDFGSKYFPVTDTRVDIDFDWINGHTSRRVNIRSRGQVTRIRQTVNLMADPHPEGIKDSVDITIKIVQPSNKKALSGKGTVRQLK